jgi:hypothetical protein
MAAAQPAPTALAQGPTARGQSPEPIPAPQPNPQPTGPQTRPVAMAGRRSIYALQARRIPDGGTPADRPEPAIPALAP